MGQHKEELSREAYQSGPPEPTGYWREWLANQSDNLPGSGAAVGVPNSGMLQVREPKRAVLLSGPRERPAADGPSFPVPLCDVPRLVPVGVRTSDGVRDRGLRPVATALRFPYLGVNAANARGVLLFDCDEPERARAAIRSGSVPAPSWMSVSTTTGRLHAGFVLSGAVHLGQGSRRKPAEYLADIERTLTGALGADPAYSGRLTANPWFPDLMRSTEWGETSGRDLGELIPACGLPKVSATADELTAWGRNTSLFLSLCREAEALAFALRWDGAVLRPLDVGALAPQLRAVAARVNAGFYAPLPTPETDGIIRSVCRYAGRWTHWKRVRGREVGRAAGRASGAKRREANRERDDQILRLREDGETLRSIAWLVGCGVGSVHRVISRECSTNRTG